MQNFCLKLARTAVGTACINRCGCCGCPVYRPYHHCKCNPAQRSPCLEANSFSGSREIPRILWSPNLLQFYFYVLLFLIFNFLNVYSLLQYLKHSATYSVLIGAVHLLEYYLHKFNFIIILPSTLSSFKCSLFFGVFSPKPQQPRSSFSWI